jgi:hypothetical protein
MYQYLLIFRLNHHCTPIWIIGFLCGEQFPVSMRQRSKMLRFRQIPHRRRSIPPYPILTSRYYFRSPWPWTSSQCVLVAVFPLLINAKRTPDPTPHPMASTSGGPGSGSSPHYAHTLHNKSSSLTLCTIGPAVDSSSSSLPSSPTEYSRLFGPLSLHVRSTHRYVTSDNTLNRPDADLGIRLEDDEVNLPKFKLWDLKRRPLLHAALQMAGIFLISTILLGGTLWLALPTLSECVDISIAFFRWTETPFLPVQGKIGHSFGSQRLSQNCRI